MPPTVHPDYGTRYFGELSPERECGDCIACCHVFAINYPELKKEPGVMCLNCENGGCKIYETRPQGCRNFYCLWRRDMELDDAMRPDKSGVVFSIEDEPNPQNAYEPLSIRVTATHDAADFDKPDVQAAIWHMRRQYLLPVWIGFNGLNFLVWPDKAMTDIHDNPANTPEGPAKVAAMGWMQDYLAELKRRGIPAFKS